MIAPGFENANRGTTAFRRMVDQHRHAMVGIDLQKVRLELIAASDVAGNDLVVETKLFEQDRDLLAVWRRPKVDIEHRYFLWEPVEMWRMSGQAAFALTLGSAARAARRISSAPFSAIMMVGALVLVEVTVGITDASMTRRRSSPWTRS